MRSTCRSREATNIEQTQGRHGMFLSFLDGVLSVGVGSPGNFKLGSVLVQFGPKNRFSTSVRFLGLKSLVLKSSVWLKNSIELVNQ